MIRDLFHGILGFATGYFLFTFTDAQTFTNDGKAFGVLPLSLFFGVAINFVFNWVQGYFYKIESSRDEYYLGAIGGLYGGALAMLLPNVWFAYGVFILCIGYATFDLLNTKKQ